jgi:hypothetical protein
MRRIVALTLVVVFARVLANRRGTNMRKLLSPILCVLLTTAAFAKGPYGEIHVGNWSGGAFTNDATGKFSGCTASTTYQNGVNSIIFTVRVTETGGWMWGFINQQWQLTPGEAIPVDLVFDGHDPVHVFAQAITPVFVKIDIPPTSALYNTFRLSKSMQAVAKGQVYGFNLPATSRLMPILVECVKTVNAHGLGAAPRFTDGKPASPAPVQAVAPPPPPVPPITTLAPPPPPEPNTLHEEAMQLAADFILHGAFQNPHVLARSETPANLVSIGAGWKADEAIGAVKIIPGNMEGLDVAAAVAAGDSKECAGKFASGRVSELVDSSVVFRGFSTCDDTSGSRFAQYFIVPRKQGGYVIFSVVSAMRTEQEREVVKDEKLTSLRRAAWTSVNYTASK